MEIKLLEIENVLIECLGKLEEDNYTGYDPADLLNSSYRFISKMPGTITKLLSLVNIYSPVNFRRLLRIKPAQNTTAMVKLAQIYLILFEIYKKDEYMDKVIFFIDWLMKKTINENGTIGWNRTINYQYDSKVRHDKDSSLTFINAQMVTLLLNMYDIDKQQQYLDRAIQVADHITYKTNQIKNFDGVCLSYISKGNLEIFNASILAGNALNRIYSYKPNKDYLNLSEQILQHTLNVQFPDGSWAYSYKNRKYKTEQIDFHQVYMLEGIMYQITQNNERTKQAFEKGYKFYINKMFDKKGRPFWRYPKKYPIDIHNIAHAIYFLSSYPPPVGSKVSIEGLLDYLLKEFYNAKDKFFYFHKYPLFKNKINYFRWNTVWTLYALSIYLKNNKS